MSDELEVWLHQSKVGRLTRARDTDDIQFVLAQDWLDTLNRPVLGQIFLDQKPRRLKSRVHLPPWFSNLLPEGVLRDFLALRARVSPEREFFLLEQLGADLPGAVEVRSVGPPSVADELDLALPATVDPGEPLKFSLAGLQLKFSAVADADRWRLPARGMGGRWLLKLPDSRHDHVPRNEFATMSWAQTLGIDVPRVRLVELESVDGLPPEVRLTESKAVAVERFDRLPDSRERIHIEDFLQVLNRYPWSREKYRAANLETLANIILAVAGVEDLHEFIRRTIFNLIIGNGDAHLKNWSLIYRDQRTARLSPAYDLVSTVQYMFDDGMALNLANNKAWSLVTLDHFARLQTKLRSDVEQMAPDVVVSWVREFAGQALELLPGLMQTVDSGFVETLRLHWKRTPLLGELGFR